MKTAFLFPGQGSQYIGMGSALLKSYPQARKIFEEAGALLGLDLCQLCLGGPEEELRKTENLQPLLVTFCFTVSKILTQSGVQCEAMAGHSVGEYSALASANVLQLPDVLRLVRKRAQLMATAGHEKEGAMAAVIGLGTEETEKVCSRFPGIWVVNYNCPGQQVISGKAGQMPQAAEALKEAGAKRIIPLAVSGAFHSPLMSEAARIFSHYLKQFSFHNPYPPIISNAPGEYACDASSIRANLSLQMDHPVLWEKSMRRLLADGFEVFIEIGPGTVLQGLMKRINRRATVLGIDGSPESFKRVKQLAMPD